MEGEATTIKQKQAKINGLAGIGGQRKWEDTGSVGGVPYQSAQGAKTNEDLVNFLEHKLEEIERKLMHTQHDYDTLQREYMEL